jgi:hypothetical protein
MDSNLSSLQLLYTPSTTSENTRHHLWLCYQPSSPLSLGLETCRQVFETPLAYPVLGKHCLGINFLDEAKPWNGQNLAQTIWNFKSSKWGRLHSISNSNWIWTVPRHKPWKTKIIFGRGSVIPEAVFFPSTGCPLCWMHWPYIDLQELVKVQGIYSEGDFCCWVL